MNYYILYLYLLLWSYVCITLVLFLINTSYRTYCYLSQQVSLAVALLKQQNHPSMKLVIHLLSRNIFVKYICLDFIIHLYISKFYESVPCCACFIMQLLTWEFDWKYMVRGLVLDKKRGNILKVSYNCLNLPPFLEIILRYQLVK